MNCGAKRADEADIVVWAWDLGRSSLGEMVAEAVMVDMDDVMELVEWVNRVFEQWKSGASKALKV